MGDVVNLFLTPKSLEARIGFTFSTSKRNGSGNKDYRFSVEMVGDKPQQVLLIRTYGSYRSLLETLAVYDSSSANTPSRVMYSKGKSPEISLNRIGAALVIDPPTIPAPTAEAVFSRAIAEYLEFKETNRIDEALSYRSSIKLLNKE
ncbi:MAG TPA: hypothetical protein VJB08_06545 [Candidatus Nanoarchaeia archaeon]|nr:hypothetical protein [Candidatus Nanoarchaeia archaeon]